MIFCFSKKKKNYSYEVYKRAIYALYHDMFAICIFIIVYTVFKTRAPRRKWKGVEKNPNFITSTTATGAVFFF